VVDLDRVSDLELLRQVAKVQDAEIHRLHQQLMRMTEALGKATKADADEIKGQLALLQAQLKQIQERAYGNKSERRPRGDKPTKEKQPQEGHGPTPQPKLKLEDVIHELDEADKACPSCGGALQPWEGQFEDSEEVDVVEVQYVLKRHRRQKYRCGCGGCIETAIGPTKLLEGGRYSVPFAVHVASEKFDSHLPLERQAKRMARAGLDVTTQTLWDQLFALSRCFTVAIERLHQYLISKEVLMGDETRWPLLGVSGRASKNWFDWVLVAEDAVLHSIRETRSNHDAREILRGFKGTMLSDGYGVYASMAGELGFSQAHDWCHARRYFIEAEATAPAEAKAILDDIGKLFMVEREIVEAFAGQPIDKALEIRRAMRQERSKPIVARIGALAQEVRALPESPVGRAVKYLVNQWDGLLRFLSDPRVPLTSNAAEAALRCLVLGRNNHFGSKSKRGTEVAAMFYSLIECARLNDLDPVRYLKFGAEAHLRGEVVPLPHELRQADRSAMLISAPVHQLQQP
jgi:transposase